MPCAATIHLFSGRDAAWLAVAIAVVSGDAAPVDQAADLGGGVRVGTVEDRVELAQLGGGGVAGQFALESLLSGTRRTPSAEIVASGGPKWG
jgi:hypothetical protein